MEIKATHFSNSGPRRGPCKENEKPWRVVMEGRKESEKIREELSTSSFKLGIGIGIGVFSSCVGESVISDEKSYRFTSAQLHELQQQSFIYKHIVSGISVPIHLVLPVLRSVARTLETSEDGIYKLYPSFIGYGHQGFDYRSIMDTEPGRCRRTDGKKWRCKKKTVPDQKYCEQHMHRGRQRSRKLVEAYGVSSSNAIHSKNLKGGLENSALNLSASRSTNFRHCTPSPTSSYDESKRRVSCNTVSSITSNAASGTITVPASIATNYITIATAATVARSNSVTIATAATTASSNSVTVATAAMAVPINSVTIATTATAASACTRTKSSQIIGKDDSRILDGYVISRNCTEQDHISVGQNLSLGLGLSPKTVLQVVSGNGVCLEKRSGAIEFDQPGRCRRTDGKKWRCSRDTIPDQKYCARHMHRGAKKRGNVFQPAADDASADNTALLPPITDNSCCADGKTPNTNLSISMLESSLLVRNDEKSTSSSSSDTTLTDTSITAYAISNVSS